MAFKPTRLSDQSTAVSIFDPAIDPDQSDLERYKNERGRNPAVWRECIKANPGERLTEFVIGVVPPDMFSRINDDCVPHDPNRSRQQELGWRCFLHGIREIQGFESEDEAKVIKVGGVDYVDPQWLKKKFSRSLLAVAIEIGHLIWRFNQIDETEIKN